MVRKKKSKYLLYNKHLQLHKMHKKGVCKCRKGHSCEEAALRYKKGFLLVREHVKKQNHWNVRMLRV